MKEELKRLPTKLYDAYSIAVNRIQSQSRAAKDVGMGILAWVIHAFRPLTVPELQHALATRDEDTQFDEDGIMAANEFITRTAGLLTIQNGKVQCVHHTIEEFLKGPGCQDKAYFQCAEKSIAITCLTYLKFEEFKDPSDDLEKRASQFPFLKYAGLHWGYHASKCLEQEPGLFGDFSEVFERDGIPLGSLQVIAAKVLQNPRSGRISIWKNNTPKLHMAIACGLDKFTEMIILNGEVDLEETGYKQETALHIAARSSCKRATELLLQHNANVNATNYSGKTALDMVMVAPYQRVSMKIQEPKFLQVLLLSLVIRLFNKSSRSLPHELSEIDKNTKSSLESQKIRESLLEIMTHRRSQKASQLETQLIITRGYKMDITEQDEEIVRLLLDAKIDVNSQGYPEATALQLSATYGRRNLVQLLLDKDANPFLVRDLGYDALTLARHCGHEDIVQLLEQKMELLRKLEMEKLDDEAKLGTFLFTGNEKH